MLLGTVLSPIVDYLDRWHLPAPVSAALLVIALALIIAGTARAIAEPLSEWLDMLPATASMLWSDSVHWWSGLTHKMGMAASTANAVPPQVAAQGLSWTGSLMALMKEVVAGALVAVVLLYFILSAQGLFTLKLVRVIPRLHDKVRAVEIIKTVRREVGTYFATITLINIGLGLCTALAMYLLDMPTPLLWGVMATLFNFIPYLGPLTGLVVLTLAAMHSFATIGQIIVVPAVFFGLVLLEGQILSPHIVGRRLQCNPVVVFGSFAVWGWLWGVAGLIVAVPILVVLKTFFQHIPSFASLAEFLSRD
jgi:predicted PurR-regulated permease PerM